MDAWGSHTLEPGVWYRFRIDRLAVWLRRGTGEWEYSYGEQAGEADSPEPKSPEAVSRESDSPQADSRAADSPVQAGETTPSHASNADTASSNVLPDCPPPEDATYGRYVTGRDFRDAAVTLRPAAPDLPTYVRCGSPIGFAPGSDAELFLPIPLWAVISLEQQGTLLDIPVRTLSRSWVGGNIEGTLCYSLTADPQPDRNVLQVTAGEAVCALRVRNNSTETYRPTGFLVLTDQMAVYRSGYGAEALMISNASVTVSKQNEVSSGVSRLRASRDSRHGPGASLETISEPRVGSGESWWKWGVSLFQRIGNYS